VAGAVGLGGMGVVALDTSLDKAILGKLCPGRVQAARRGPAGALIHLSGVAVVASGLSEIAKDKRLVALFHGDVCEIGIGAGHCLFPSLLHLHLAPLAQTLQALFCRIG